MKTTIEISDALLRAAKRMATERNTTLRMIVEARCGGTSRRPPMRRKVDRGCAATAFAGAACSRA